MKDLNKLIETLPNLNKWVWQTVDGKRDFVTVDVKPRAFVRDGLLTISMEEGDTAGDYYGHYINEWEQSGVPYINEKLEQWAKALGAYWEWHDAGSIVLAL